MSEMEFTGKVAVITGAASGMGELTTREIVARGGRVMMLDLNEAHLKELEAELGDAVLGRVVDVRRYEDIESAVQAAKAHFGRIDITVSFAGGSCGRICKDEHPFTAYRPETIEWGIDVNFRAPIYMARAVYDIMEAQGTGVIINIGSIDGVTGSGWDGIYSACKAGLIGLTKSLAKRGAEHGVRSCCVSPGPVMTRPNMKNMKTAMNRAAEPIEVVNLVLYLASDKAAFISGDNYLIDGARAVDIASY